MKKGILRKRTYPSSTKRLKLSFALAIHLWSSAVCGDSLKPPTAERPELVKIENFLANADYEPAREFITQLLNQNDLAQTFRSQLYWLKAVCHVSENQNTQAKASFLKLLAINPLFEPAENTSPKILTLYKETFDAFKKQGGLALSLESVFAPIEAVVAGEPFVFQVRIDDAPSRKKIDRLEFHVRRLGNSEYSSLDFNKVEDKTSPFEVTIPPVLTMRVDAETTFEYYVDFHGQDGSRLGGIGKNTLPLTFEVNTKRKTADKATGRKSERGVAGAAIWISAAAVTVAGVVTLAFALSTPDEGSLRVKVFPPE